MSLKRLSILLMAITITMFTFVGCTEKGADFGENNGSSEKLSGKVTMSGSTSVEDLANALGSKFNKINPDVSVDVQSGGSSVGITNAKENVTDIGNSSRALKPEEKKLGLKEYTIAIDGIAVIVNPSNKVSDLTMEQLSDIFTGKITNWSKLGGPNEAIVVIGREAGSGTRDGFEEIVKIKDRAKYTIEANETGLVKTKVKEEKYAIGYISVGKLDETVKTLKIDNIAPTGSNIKDKTYQLQRPFLCLTKEGSETTNTKAFLEFILSDEGQAIVEEHGYISVK